MGWLTSGWKWQFARARCPPSQAKRVPQHARAARWVFDPMRRRMLVRSWLAGTALQVCGSLAKAKAPSSPCVTDPEGAAPFCGPAGALAPVHDDAALRAVLESAVASNQRELVVAPGVYALKSPLRLQVASPEGLTIHMAGVVLDFTAIAPAKNQACFWLRGNGRNALKLTGLETRLNRPSVRTSGSDMVRVSGFALATVEGITVPSADNMALTIGRGDVFSFTPQSVVVRASRFGGARLAVAHGYGSIGDTAVWIVTPGQTTEVTDCVIEQTGDDGIFVGHSASAEIRDVLIADNRLSLTSGGIGVAVPHARILRNTISITNNCAIRCEVQNGNQASHALIADNRVHGAGQMEQGQIGLRMIPKWHPHAVMIYQGGGQILIKNNTFEWTRGSAICLMPHAEQGDLSDIRIIGGLIREVGVHLDGTSNQDGKRHGVLRRAAVDGKAVHDVVMDGVTVDRLTASLVVWINRECDYERPLSVRNILLRESAILDLPVVYWEGKESAFGVSKIRISVASGVITHKVFRVYSERPNNVDMTAESPHLIVY